MTDLPDVLEAAVEAVARVEAEHRFARWSARGGCWVSECVGCGAEVEALDWRTDGDEAQREHRAQASVAVLIEQGWKPPETEVSE